MTCKKYRLNIDHKWLSTIILNAFYINVLNYHSKKTFVLSKEDSKIKQKQVTS